MGTDIAAVLEKAADYIDEHGWRRETYLDDDGHVCVLGAINAVISGDPRAVDPATWDAKDALHHAVPAFNIVAWNDAPSRTQAEVTAKLREVAAAERAKAGPQ